MGVEQDGAAVTLRLLICPLMKGVTLTLCDVFCTRTSWNCFSAKAPTTVGRRDTGGQRGWEEPGAAPAGRRLTVVLREGDDRRPGVLHHLAGLHVSASVGLLGEVEAQLVHQALRVHLRQIGDQNTARTDDRIHLRDREVGEAAAGGQRPMGSFQSGSCTSTCWGTTSWTG